MYDDWWLPKTQLAISSLPAGKFYQLPILGDNPRTNGSVVERQSPVREVVGSNSGQTNTHSLKIIEEKVLPLQLHQQMVRLLRLLG